MGADVLAGGRTWPSEGRRSGSTPDRGTTSSPIEGAESTKLGYEGAIPSGETIAVQRGRRPSLISSASQVRFLRPQPIAVSQGGETVSYAVTLRIRFPPPRPCPCPWKGFGPYKPGDTVRFRAGVPWAVAKLPVSSSEPYKIVAWVQLPNGLRGKSEQENTLP